MKKTFFLMSMALMLAPLSSFAFQSQAGDTINVMTPITQDYYAAGGTINITTSASNDLTVIGGKNFINSTVKQDLMVAGGEVVINGSVGESAKIAGGNVNLNSAIQKDLFIGGGDVIVGPNSMVQGDTLIGAGKLRLDGTLNNANLNAGEMILQGIIRGNAIIRAEKIQVLPGAKILGNLEYHSSQKNISLEQIVSGQITFKQLPVKTGMQILASILGGYLAFGFLFLALFGILFFYVGREWFVKPIKSLKEGIWSSLGYGFLIYAVIPFAIFLLMVSMIGVPFGLLLVAIYACLFAFYKLFNVVFYSHLLIDKLGGMKKVKTWKQIGIILLCALISAVIATVDILFSFFALGAVIKTYIVKSKK